MNVYLIIFLRNEILVYDNSKARRDLGWQPVYDFSSALKLATQEEPIQSPLASIVGVKGYHRT